MPSSDMLTNTGLLAGTSFNKKKYIFDAILNIKIEIEFTFIAESCFLTKLARVDWSTARTGNDPRYCNQKVQFFSINSKKKIYFRYRKMSKKTAIEHDYKIVHPLNNCSKVK